MTERITPELLSVRSDALITSFQRMADNGLDIRKLRRVEANEDVRREVRDLFCVGLGIKPSAFLVYGTHHVFDGAFMRPSHLEKLPEEKDIGFHIQTDVDMQAALIWNVPMMNLILEEYGAPPFAQEKKTLRNFYNLVASTSSSRQNTVIEGILLGIPREAAEFGNDFYAVLDSAREYMREDFYPLAVIENRNGVQERIIKALETNGLVEYDFIEKIRASRVAQVPGFQYTTYGNLTTEHEQRITGWYEQSRIEDKYQAFLG